MTNRPLFTIAIPSYNRAEYLSPLLDSILSQSNTEYEILICEDFSPERSLIAEVVKTYQAKYPGIIRYLENRRNLGYDANIRKLVTESRGHYCVFMGNDDLLCVDALTEIEDILRRHRECGVVVRTYATFDSSPNKYKQVFRYFDSEHVVGPGKDAISLAFRRSVVIPGMVIHRDSAAEIATSDYDGTLLYQLYLVGLILKNRSVVFTPRIVALRRDGVAPDFGASDAEKGKFVPQDQTPASSIHFMKGMLRIAKDIQKITGLDVFKEIMRDIGNYSYPILAIQANRKKKDFILYGISLANIGLWKSPLFHLYFYALLLLGPKLIDWLIIFLKTRFGFTPLIGSVGKSSK